MDYSRGTESLILTALKSIACGGDTKSLGHWERKVSTFVHHEQFCEILLNSILDSTELKSVRQLAAIMLQRFLSASWDPQGLDENELASLTLRKQKLRSILLANYTNQVDRQIEKCIADVISEVAAFENFPECWTSLLDKIRTDLKSTYLNNASNPHLLLQTCSLYRANFHVILSLADCYVLDKDNVSTILILLDSVCEVVRELSVGVTSHNMRPHILECLQVGIMTYTRLMYLYMRFKRQQPPNNLIVTFVEIGKFLMIEQSIPDSQREDMMFVRQKVVHGIVIFHRALRKSCSSEFEILMKMILNCLHKYSNHFNNQKTREFLSTTTKLICMVILNYKQKQQSVDWFEDYLNVISLDLLILTQLEKQNDEDNIIEYEMSGWQGTIRSTCVKAARILFSVFKSKFSKALFQASISLKAWETNPVNVVVLEGYLFLVDMCDELWVNTNKNLQQIIDQLDNSPESLLLAGRLSVICSRHESESFNDINFSGGLMEIFQLRSLRAQCSHKQLSSPEEILNKILVDYYENYHFQSLFIDVLACLVKQTRPDEVSKIDWASILLTEGDVLRNECQIVTGLELLGCSVIAQLHQTENQSTLISALSERLKSIARQSFEDSYNASLEAQMIFLLEMLALCLLDGSICLSKESVNALLDVELMSILRTICHMHYCSASEIASCAQNYARGCLHRVRGESIDDFLINELLETTKLIISHSLGTYSAPGSCKYIDMTFAPYADACSLLVEDDHRDSIRDVLRAALSKAYSCTLLQEKAAVLGMFAASFLINFQMTIEYLLQVPGPEHGCGANFVISELMWIFPYLDVDKRAVMFIQTFVKMLNTFSMLVQNNGEVVVDGSKVPLKRIFHSKMLNTFYVDVFGDLLNEYKNDSRMSICSIND